jgi:hypothetical protein
MSASEPKRKHNTPPLAIEDFRPGYLKPQSYSAEVISKAIIDLVSRPEENYTERQWQGIQKPRAHGGWSLAEPENVDNLETFFDIFNDVLFNGVLTGYCTVSFYTPGSILWFANVGAYCHTGYYPGREQHHKFKIKRPRCNIKIREFHNDSKKFTPMFRMRVYQNRIVHECCMLYSRFTHATVLAALRRTAIIYS